MTMLASDLYGEDFVFFQGSYYSELFESLSTKLRAPSLNQKMVKEVEVIDSIVTLSIPLEVITDILSRLPFKTLQRFKCVCKTWLHLLTRDSYFAKLHCERVMVGLTCYYDFVMDKLGPVRRSYYPIVRRTPSSVSRYYLKGVCKSFYGDCTTYSLRTLVRQLNASGFPQHVIRVPYWMRRKGFVSFCEGHYEVQEAECRRKRMESLSFGSSKILRCRTLVLVPDKEAARKIEVFMQERAYYLGHKIHLCVGENSVWEDRHILRSGVHVVVGTPHCVLDILQWQFVNPDLIAKFALFEADVVFSKGYKDTVYDVLKLLPEKVQVKLISATITREALEIPRKFWDITKGQWKRETPQCDDAVEYMKEILRKEKTKLVKCDKKSVKLGDFGKLKLIEQRKKKSTISWNPHLKRHM
ncbi:hypothetical protein ACHQM5_029712 [Ranunculus cassubicifolius]